jgi:hypothetical protein
VSRFDHAGFFSRIGIGTSQTICQHFILFAGVFSRKAFPVCEQAIAAA